MLSSTIPIHRLAGGKVDEVQSRARGTGERFKISSFPDILLLEMRLHVHARLGAAEYDQIGHQRSMTARGISSLI
jgi:hypothetical protein